METSPYDYARYIAWIVVIPSFIHMHMVNCLKVSVLLWTTIHIIRISDVDIKHTPGVKLDGLFLRSCNMANINSHILQCQVLYEQFPINGTDPHLLIHCIIVLHVNSIGDQPCHCSFWVRTRATIPYFSGSIGITAGRTNWASQGIITTQDYWHYCWNCRKWHMLGSLEYTCVVSHKRYSDFCRRILLFCAYLWHWSNGMVAML